MTKMSARLAAAIASSKLPDKEIARIINEAGTSKPAQAIPEAQPDSAPASEAPAPAAPETPSAESGVGAMGMKKRQYRRRDMRAE